MDDVLSDSQSSRSINSSRSADKPFASSRNIDTQIENYALNSYEDEFADAEEYGEISVHGEASRQEPQNVNREVTIRFIDDQVALHLTRYIKRRAEDLTILRIKLQMEPLVPQNLTDEQLIIYLFTAKYNIAAAVTLIRSNYKLRFMLPNLFTSRNTTAQDMTDMWEALRASPFPKRTVDHQHIAYIGLRMKSQPEVFDAHYAVKLMLMCAEVYYILEGIPCSMIIILDADGASYGYFTQTNYEHLKIVIKYVQESMPYNVEAVHVINSTALVKGLFKFIKPFLTKDIIKTVFFHKNSGELSRVIPLKLLPAELGGSCPGSIDEYQKEFREKFEQMQEFFEMEEEQRAARYFGPLKK